jgi:hypothetical protein
MDKVAPQEREFAKKFKKKVYTLIPQPDTSANYKRRFVELTPQAAVSLLFDFCPT